LLLLMLLLLLLLLLLLVLLLLLLMAATCCHTASRFATGLIHLRCLGCEWWCSFHEFACVKFNLHDAFKWITKKHIRTNGAIVCTR
jgi:hypothetical protein